MSALVVPAPLWRRLCAALYDGLLLAALWVAATALMVIIRNYAGLALDVHAQRALIFLTGFVYCGTSWVRGGQTLGMRVWRLRVRRSDGGSLRWPAAALRYGVAWISWLALGAGIWWCAVDRQRRAWHDIAAGTEVIVEPT